MAARTQFVSPDPEPAASILVVEDQPEVQQALSMLLCTVGYKVQCAASPEEALEYVAREQFDLILLDLNYRRDTTSGSEGLQLISLLRSRGIEAPVIAMTAWGSIEVAVQAMHTGACDFLQKPWDNAHVIKLVSEHVAEQRRKREAMLREKREWQDAVDVHRRLMPRELPHIEGLSMAAVSRPMSFIGGDYYDVFSMGEKIAICIGDVIGKGLPAALMMSNLQAAVKVTAAHWVSPAEVCHAVNQLACGNGACDKFISFFYAVLDRRTLELQYCNCGHNPPLLHRADGRLERLETGGTLIGVRASEWFQEGATQISRGDRLLLYTDGVSEAENAEGEEYGEQRIINMLAQDGASDADRLLNALIADVATHCNAQFHDDVTVLAICANPGEL